MPSTLVPRLSSLFPRSIEIESWLAGALKSAIPLALFGVLWLDLIRQLSYQWSTNEQYSYGWFVPIFALGLLWRRWVCRPVPRPVAAPAWLIALVAMLAAVLLPARVIHEANPDWPLCSWLLALSAVGISLYAVFLM